jgi:DNA ligase D-like protein (predicted 3'-phosphoesterase)
MPLFTIQQHAATTLHFDFRLEVDGVLRSWAVPKGPSTDPADKRLAVQVPDHPLSYADFEGRLGPGYGEGAVIVWDMGDYQPLTDGDFGAALDDGHASFRLEGRKLVGAWTLRRTDGGRKPQWLLIKKRDDDAGDGAPLPPESVLSGRTIEDL